MVPPPIVAEGRLAERLNLTIYGPAHLTPPRNEYTSAGIRQISTSDAPSVADHTRFVVGGTIHGDAVLFMVDYGEVLTQITSLVRHALAIRSGGGVRVGTSGGDAAPAAADSVSEDLILDSLWIGKSLQLRAPVEAVNADESVTYAEYGTNGLLGRNVLQRYDLEFNFPEGRFRMYQPPGGGVRRSSPPWLPPGMTDANCARGQEDTTAVSFSGSSAPRPMHSVSASGVGLALLVNGHPIAGAFDSGNNVTVMNWAEARVLGLTPTSPLVQRGAFAKNAFPDHPTAASVEGVTVRLAGQTLAAEPIVIDDEWIAFTREEPVDSPSLREPAIVVGLDAFKDRVLFLSHTSGMACVIAPKRS